MSECWLVKSYPSGTAVVVDKNAPMKPYAYGVAGLTPHFTIRGPGGETESQQEQNKLQCCRDICDYLNGVKPRPAWLDDMERVDETTAIALDGTRIIVEGPSIDKDPPRCWWVLDESPSACSMRVKLMNRLFWEKA